LTHDIFFNLKIKKIKKLKKKSQADTWQNLNLTRVSYFFKKKFKKNQKNHDLTRDTHLTSSMMS